ncbi:MAG: MocR-like pyridoxine biosynthesis transcription factor PdxR [Anaerolineae bacterium]
MLNMDDANIGAGEMQLALQPKSNTPIYRQIESQIRALILSGRLPQGCRLPSERALAQRLGVNRTTVVNAYRELAADGLIAGHVGQGTLVLGIAPRQEEESSFSVPLAWTGLIRSRPRESSLARRVATLSVQEGIISLAAGTSDPLPSPYLHLERAIKRVLAVGSQELLEDSPAEGLPSLRVELARRLALNGCGKVSPRQVFVLSGSQQGLYLVAQLLLQPGDAVLVESPTYLGALEVFHAVGARLVGVPLDEWGMQVEAAERLLAHAGVRLIYTIPNFQNPTGSTLSGERRKRLLSLAQRYQVPILEDDLYGDFSYGASPPAPIRALDANGYVLYLGSLSPLLGSGLRLGWLLVPPAVTEPLLALRQAMDLHPNNFVQAVVRELIADGSLEAHLEWVRRVYARRRDAIVSALQQHMPAEVRWHNPEGGFFIWCSLPEPLTGRQLLEEAAATGVVFVPGELFFPNGNGERFLRLNFAHLPEEDVEEGVRRLASALRRLQATTQQRPEVSQATRPVV